MRDFKGKIWLPYVRTGTGSDVFTFDLAEGLSRLGADVHLESFSKKYEPAPMLLRRARPPIGTTAILANSWNAFAFAREGIRLVCVEHLFILDPKYTPFKSTFQRVAHSVLIKNFLKWSYDACDVLTSPSQSTADAISSWLPSTRPTVVLNGVDIGFYRPVPRARKWPRKLLFVSTHSRRKGYDLLPQIIEHLGSGFELSVAGEKETYSNLKARFLGRLDRVGVRKAYQQADLLLMPSRLEGLSLAALEAMACGTPVVAFNTSSFPEIIDSGRNGMLAPYGHAVDFAETVADAASEGDKLQVMSEAAAKTIRERFDRNRAVREYFDLLTKF